MKLHIAWKKCKIMAVQTVSRQTVQKAPKLLTGEDLFALGDIGRTELIKGELIRMAPTGYPHGIIENNFGRVLGDFAHQRKLGHVLVGEVGIYTHRDPDTVRGADVAYISKARLTQVRSSSYLDVAPELIIEVLSPSDAWSDVIEKLEEYFVIGVQSVWIADPTRQEVFVYHSLTDVRRFPTDTMLTEESILPGFEVVVAEFFEVAFDE
jgi:Uma2 family endonuclease